MSRPVAMVKECRIGISISAAWASHAILLPFEYHSAVPGPLLPRNITHLSLHLRLLVFLFGSQYRLFATMVVVGY